MRDIEIRVCEIVMHPFVCVSWRAAHEIVDHVGEMQEETDGVDEQEGADHGGDGRVVE